MLKQNPRQTFERKNIGKRFLYAACFAPAAYLLYVQQCITCEAAEPISWHKAFIFGVLAVYTIWKVTLKIPNEVSQETTGNLLDDLKRDLGFNSKTETDAQTTKTQDTKH